MKKKTHDEFIEEIGIINPDIEIIGKYEGNKKHIGVICKRCGNQYDSTPNNLLSGKRCKICANIDNGKNKRKTNIQFIKELLDLDLGIIALDEYQGKETKINFQCTKGHIWESRPSDILHGYGCPFCSGNKVLKGFNDMWTTNPDMARMLLYNDLGYKLSEGSNKKVDFICPDCGAPKRISPHQLGTYGLACHICSDGISYPNKFARALLKQLPVCNVQYEWNPDWLKPYFYDNYFEYNGLDYILEMDGGLGHGQISFNSSKKDIDGIKRDILKDNLAKEHGLIVIRIDCNYRNVLNRFEYIKNNIINSELSKMFDLNSIDFDLCNQTATKSLSLQAANLYDQGLKIKDISSKLEIPYSTIYTWLKRLSSEGLCSYQPILGRPKI